MARLPEALVGRLDTTPQSGSGYWIIVLRLRDGREYGGIGVVDGEIVSPPVPIDPREIAAIGLETGEWVHVEDPATIEDADG